MNPSPTPTRGRPFPGTNGSLSHMIVTLHPEEFFTREQAVPVFRACIKYGMIRPRELLCPLDV